MGQFRNDLSQADAEALTRHLVVLKPEVIADKKYNFTFKTIMHALCNYFSLDDKFSQENLEFNKENLEKNTPKNALEETLFRLGSKADEKDLFKNTFKADGRVARFLGIAKASFGDANLYNKWNDNSTSANNKDDNTGKDTKGKDDNSENDAWYKNWKIWAVI